MIVKSYLLVKKKDLLDEMSVTIFYVAEANLNRVLWLFHVCVPSLTKCVYNALKATIHKYLIQISMNMNITRSRYE